VRNSGRKDRMSTEAADLDEDEYKNNGSSSSAADSEEEDEVAEVATMVEEQGDAAERVDVTPCDKYKSAEDQNTTERQTEPRCRRSHMGSTGCRREMSGVANDPPDTTGAGTDRGGGGTDREAAQEKERERFTKSTTDKQACTICGTRTVSCSERVTFRTWWR
jgi:hypothetical protein